MRDKVGPNFYKRSSRDYHQLLRDFQEFKVNRKLQRVFTEKEKPPAEQPGAQKNSSFYRGGMDVV